ncbi:MAG: tRNA 2-thiouridine(34) synthase MnmA [Hyphomicrobiales bacterium]|nr:tRNA 2-thiouridine(34) synthase MnmA [Hyphomicrobiales bacterium]
MLNSLDLPGLPNDTRIVVAMSGGVDSSVVAGLLAREGYDVVGMTLQLYDHGEAIHRKGACCAGQDIHDAKRVADTLGISHYVLNYENRFQEAVIDSFADSYMAGETPIPCVTCNQTVKFVDLLATAKELGAEALATGHYIRSHMVDEKTGRRAMFRPCDDSRDQSYFLFATTQDQLDYLRFPLGDLAKTRTREIACELGLDIADKSDSQDICFVPSGKYSDIISRLNPLAGEPGEIVHIDGRLLGHHEGIINYTVGQRRGIGVAVGEPIYVVHLDRQNRRVIVGPREALATHRLQLRDVNWLGNGLIEELSPDGLPIYVKVRSTRPPVEARLTCKNGDVLVDIVEGETGVAPGQACVFYADDSDDTRVLGGGFISAAHHSDDIQMQLDGLVNNGTGANL